jgi:hypothetical protein
MNRRLWQRKEQKLKGLRLRLGAFFFELDNCYLRGNASPLAAFTMRSRIRS